MNFMKKLPVLILLFSSFLTFACVYVVLPEGLEAPDTGAEAEPGVWSALVTSVGTAEAGDLHIDITIRNDMRDWSSMRAVPDKPAILTASDGKTTNCDTV